MMTVMNVMILIAFNSVASVHYHHHHHHPHYHHSHIYHLFHLNIVIIIIWSWTRLRLLSCICYLHDDDDEVDGKKERKWWVDGDTSRWIEMIIWLDSALIHRLALSRWSPKHTGSLELSCRSSLIRWKLGMTSWVLWFLDAHHILYHRGGATAHDDDLFVVISTNSIVQRHHCSSVHVTS